MSFASAKPVIFISYSHKDEPENPREGDFQWLSFVRTYLQPAVKHGIIDVWVDRHIPGGADWNAEIEEKLRGCDIFILLVSANSMASDYIIDKEIAIMRERQANKEDVHFYPLLLTPTPDVGLEKVKDKNLRPRDAKPFSGFSHHDQLQHMTEAANEIGNLANEIVQRKIATRPTVSNERPAYVHTAGLPETAYERLVGREAELRRLDDAWVAPNVNVLSLVAEGGAGKSALVNEWLRRFQADSYRGAEAVLGWSFYNQGTKERATSADEFLNWALAKLGITLATTSASAKAESIAEAIMGRRVLLLLDGVEPMQHGLDTRLGHLKDLGLRSLLRRLAAAPPSTSHGLVVLTTRLAVKDIARWRDGPAPVVDIDRLSDEAGAAVLRDNGVWGTDKQLTAAAHDFGGHPLALGLLASFLKETQTGDVRRRDHIRAYFADEDNPLHDHARRVMESYEKEWLAGQPALRAVMHIVGLFDRPASEDCLRALRQKPVIEGLTEQLVGLSEIEWLRAIARLREARLLAPSDQSSSNTLDAHSLVREWFGEKLRTEQNEAWRVANGRLYDHLRGRVKERKSATLQDLAPLYQAIPHGCRAGRHQEALDKVYRERISQRTRSGLDRYYTFHYFGASSTDLSAISWFFDRPFEVPVAGLTDASRRWILGASGLYLYSQGRFTEAHTAVKLALEIHGNKHRNEVRDLTFLLGNIAFAVGDIKGAKEWRRQYVDLSSSKIERIGALLSQADVLIASGEFDAARRNLINTEHLHRQVHRGHFGGGPQSSENIFFPTDRIASELRLVDGDFESARQIAARGLRLSGVAGLVIKAGYLSQVARADLGHALSCAVNLNPGNLEIKKYARTATTQLNQVIESLRLAGQVDIIPMGYHLRSVFRRSLGDWIGAMRDIADIEEVADVEPMPMKLCLCEVALERARLAFARSEAFAPLNGLIDSPPKPERPGEAERTRLHNEVVKELATAADYIKECGYHRRDGEISELEAVLRGDRAFATLPPRV